MQGSKLRLELPVLALQRPERGTHNLAGVFVTSAFDLLQHEALKLFCQIDISCGHGDSFLLERDFKVIIARLANIANQWHARHPNEHQLNWQANMEML